MCYIDEQKNKYSVITSVLQISVTNQQGSIKKMFPPKLKIKAACIRFSNLVMLNTFSSQVRIAVCTCLFRNLSDLNFDINKRKGTLTKLERYLGVNLLGLGPRLIKKKRTYWAAVS
jgi:hypothetical protein